MESLFKKTRLAPTPSGFLHLGNIFSFALTAAIANKTGAHMLLRIDDMDRERLDEAYVQDIFDMLSFLQIPFDEGPKTVADFENNYSQLHRLSLYNSALQQLKDEGQVYACACSRTQIARDSINGAYPGTCRHKGLPLDADKVSWRLRTAPDKIISIKTLAGETIQSTLPAEMSDLVVRKKDGYPAYQVCSLLDDLRFGVDLVVRGQDLWASTLAQLYLAELLGKTDFLNTTFHHHLLLSDNGLRKLSKSAGDTSIRYLRQQDLSPEDIYLLISKQLNTETPLRTWKDFSALIPA